MRRYGIRIVAFNGPPGSGKDAAAKYVQQRMFEESNLNPCRLSFATPLKAGVHSLMGLTLTMHEVEARGLKDTPTPELGGKTYRQAYIEASEYFVKVYYGVEAFGHIAVRQIAQHHGMHALYLVTDCGFRDELMPLARTYLPRNMLVLQIERPGHTYEGDSRGYVDLTDAGVTTERVRNDMPEELFVELCNRRIREWLHLPRS